MGIFSRPLIQPDKGQLFPDDFTAFLQTHAIKLKTKYDIVLDGAPREQAELLKDHGNAFTTQIA